MSFSLSKIGNRVIARNAQGRFVAFSAIRAISDEVQNSITEMAFSSTCVANAAYDPIEGILTITFQEDGRSYEYYVGPEVWAQLLVAESKGRFFNYVIRPTGGTEV